MRLSQLVPRDVHHLLLFFYPSHSKDDLIGALKRIRPDPMADPPELRDAVGYYIKRCRRGLTFKILDVDLSNTHDNFLVFYDQFRAQPI
jgi:hypothetical protein